MEVNNNAAWIGTAVIDTDTKGQWISNRNNVLPYKSLLRSAKRLKEISMPLICVAIKKQQPDNDKGSGTTTVTILAKQQ